MIVGVMASGDEELVKNHAALAKESAAPSLNWEFIF